MDRAEAIKILEDYKAFDFGGMSIKEIDECKKHNEALDLAIEALEREIEYGQMVVDYTKGEALKSGDWGYTNTPIDTPTDTPTNDCVSRQQAIEAIEGVDWYHVNSKGELVSGSTSDEKSWYKAEDIYEALESLKSVTPPGKVLATIKVDTEELIKRVKEEYQPERTGECCAGCKWEYKWAKECEKCSRGYTDNYKGKK